MAKRAIGGNGGKDEGRTEDERERETEKKRQGYYIRGKGRSSGHNRSNTDTHEDERGSSWSLLKGKQVDPDKLIKGRSHLTQTETIDTAAAAVSNR